MRQKWLRMWWWCAARASHGPRPATAGLCQSWWTRSCRTLSSRWRKLCPPIGASFRSSRDSAMRGFKSRWYLHSSGEHMVAHGRCSSSSACTSASVGTSLCSPTPPELGTGHCRQRGCIHHCTLALTDRIGSSQHARRRTVYVYHASRAQRRLAERRLKLPNQFTQ